MRMRLGYLPSHLKKYITQAHERPSKIKGFRAARLGYFTFSGSGEVLPINRPGRRATCGEPTGGAPASRL